MKSMNNIIRSIIILIAFTCLASCSGNGNDKVNNNSAQPKSPIVGIWEMPSSGGKYILVLNDDNTGAIANFNATEMDNKKFTYSFAGNKLTLNINQDADKVFKVAVSTDGKYLVLDAPSEIHGYRRIK